MDELWCKAKEVDVEELKITFQEKVDEIKQEIEDLDKEKVLAIAKEKGEVLKNKSEELLKLAKWKRHTNFRKRSQRGKRKNSGCY